MNIPSTQLWVGNHTQLELKAIAYIQSFVCTHNGCNVCTACRQIRIHQHHNLLWLTPEKNYYTRAELDDLMQAVSFMRSKEDPFFCIITQADVLSALCANSLLKLLEEPPTGYYFLLLTERRDAILSTIVSRCVITTHDAILSINLQAQTFLEHFKYPERADMIACMREFDRLKITELITRDLCDALCIFWINELKNGRDCTRQVTCITNALEKLPMPGSSKLFWRNLLLSLL